MGAEGRLLELSMSVASPGSSAVPGTRPPRDTFGAETMMTSRSLTLAIAALLGTVALSACGDTRGERATTGGLSGAAAGGLVGGLPGAVVGGGAGAAGGAVLDEGVEEKVGDD